MEEHDYFLSVIYRKLTFPMQISRLTISPRNDYHMKKMQTRGSFISFVWKTEQAAALTVNDHTVVLNAPYMSINRPGDTITLSPNTIRDELFCQYYELPENCNMFNLQSCFFIITPRMKYLRNELQTLVENLHHPGNADRIDMLIIQMAQEAMLNQLDDNFHPSDELPDERIFKISRRIEMYFDTDLDIEKEIGKVGLGRRSFYREWSKYFADTPKKYLLRLRFNKAKELLRSSSLPISVIAEKCGFSTVIYFIRTFREHFNITPGDYRKQHKNTQ